MPLHNGLRECPTPCFPRTVAYTTYGSRFGAVLATVPGTYTVLDAETGDPVARFTGLPEPAEHLAGFAVGGDRYVWLVATGQGLFYTVPDDPETYHLPHVTVFHARSDGQVVWVLVRDDVDEVVRTLWIRDRAVPVQDVAAFRAIGNSEEHNAALEQPVGGRLTSSGPVLLWRGPGWRLTRLHAEDVTFEADAAALTPAGVLRADDFGGLVDVSPFSEFAVCGSGVVHRGKVVVRARGAETAGRGVWLP